MNTDRIAFILNPSSGSARSRKQGEQLEKYLIDSHPNTLYKASTAKEIEILSLEFAAKNYKAVVACGGDGTVNLISKALLHSDTALMVIGLGSGNGYARHQKLPLNWREALKMIENPKVVIKDSGMINGVHFLNVAGIGFAARITEALRQQTNKGLQGYVKTVMQNLALSPFGIRLLNENSEWQGESWMVEFCNGSQWGNNFRLEPGARDDDGTLNAVIFKKMSPVKIPALGFRFAANSVPKSVDVHTIAGAEFSLTTSKPVHVHVDGDSVGLMEGPISIQVVPKSLKLWTV